MKNSTERFSNRVDSYVRYRPSYPAEILVLLRDRYHLTESSIVADIGSGTGMFSKLLLQSGCDVYGVEPNREMRQAAERLLGQNPRFHSIDATAERSSLTADSIDFVTVAQAFHWFSPTEARREFLRILKPGGCVALVWNQRKLDSAFASQYENLLRTYATEYEESSHRELPLKNVEQLFSSEKYERYLYQNQQYFDLEGLKGRTLSSSYTPTPNDPNFTSLMAGLEGLFGQYNNDGQVSFEYDTWVFVGRLEVGEQED